MPRNARRGGPHRASNIENLGTGGAVMVLGDGHVGLCHILGPSNDGVHCWAGPIGEWVEAECTYLLSGGQRDTVGLRVRI